MSVYIYSPIDRRNIRNLRKQILFFNEKNMSKKIKFIFKRNQSFKRYKLPHSNTFKIEKCTLFVK